MDTAGIFHPFLEAESLIINKNEL